MEQGIAEASSGGGTEPFVVNIVAYAEQCDGEYELTANHTYAEVAQASEEGKPIIFNADVGCSNNPRALYTMFTGRSETPGQGYYFSITLYENTYIRLDQDGWYFGS